MNILAGIVAVILIFIILQDAFETIVLPRRVSRRLRLARLFYIISWRFWSLIAKKIRSNDRKEYYLSYYGPLSLILLLVLWATCLVFGFALLQFAFGSAMHAPEKITNFGTDLYVSGTTFFTLGLGDVIPLTGVARALTIIEVGSRPGLYCARHRLSTRHLPGLFSTRGRYLSTRRPCRLALQRLGNVATPQPGPRDGRTYRTSS